MKNRLVIVGVTFLILIIIVVAILIFNREENEELQAATTVDIALTNLCSFLVNEEVNNLIDQYPDFMRREVRTEWRTRFNNDFASFFGIQFYDCELIERESLTIEEFDERYPQLFDMAYGEEIEGVYLLTISFDVSDIEGPSEGDIRASHILVATEEEARALIREINQGADFAELAREHSFCASASNGGDLGFFGRGAMVPTFDAAVFALELDEMTTEPVSSDWGYHIIIKTAEAVGEGGLDPEVETIEIELIAIKIGRYWHIII